MRRIIGESLSRIGNIRVGGRIVYHHPGLISGVAPGITGITIGKEYIVKGLTKVCDEYWVRIIDDNKKSLEIRYDLSGLRSGGYYG